MLLVFQNIGNRVLNFVSEFGRISILFYETLLQSPSLLRRRKSFFKQMEHIGTDSLPLVSVIAIFTGAVSAWQAAYQLKGIAPLSFLGTATTRAIITELGPVLTAIVIAGRIGASIAAELGSMKVTEQINALLVMGISPVRYLAVPRFWASVIMIPILVVFADIIAVTGAYFISDYFLGISPDMFFDSAKRFFYIKDFLFGVGKGIVFGAATSLIGVYLGFNASGGAEGVGKATIRAFVIISATILISDYILWMFIN